MVVGQPDPQQLAPDKLEPTIRDLGARLISEQIGQRISPDQVRLLIEEHDPNSDLALCRRHLLELLEELCGHFPYDRAVVVVASLFPAIREQLLKDFDLKWARDPERLRQFAIGSLDDEAWAELEAAMAEREDQSHPPRPS